MKHIRIGYGYDVHVFEEGRKLILGGVHIPHTKGLKGHSDADALLHAITDALLGALALGDIGTHFPDTDPAYEGADSKQLLKKSYEMILEQGYELGNMDATVVAERPKLAVHIPSMQKVIAGLLNAEPSQISLKATTSEKMGFVGREEGIAAMAMVLVHKSENSTA